MREIKLFLIFISIAIAAHSIFADPGITADISSRQGRRVQIDGFLLEWNSQNASPWGDSQWMYDAINTADGVAGYFTSQTASSCSAWVFTIDPLIHGKAIEIRIPEETASEFFAFDRGSFENYGIHTVEWVVHWDVLGEKISCEYRLLLNAASACGDTLPQITLTTCHAPDAAPESSWPVYIIMALAGVMTGVIVAVRRRRRILG
jgi:hypothetical protein